MVDTYFLVFQIWAYEKVDGEYRINGNFTIFKAFQIANLVKEYTEVLQTVPKEVKKRESKRTGSTRPVSILHKPVPVIESTS